MNRKEFGNLVRALRRERIDREYTKWTQKDLVEEAKKKNPLTHLNISIIGKIERGDKKLLEEDILLDLADALNLTTGERKGFFAAASGISNEKIARSYKSPAKSATKTLADLSSLLQKVEGPAFIVDAYLDIISVNTAALYLYGLDLYELTKIKERSDNMNVLRFLFSPEFKLQHEAMDRKWEDLAWFNLMNFRTYSLQYRGTKYFSKLIEELQTYLKFRQYWSEVPHYEQDHPTNHNVMSLNSPQWGRLEFITTGYDVLTHLGLLQLIVYAPMNKETAIAFGRMAHKKQVFNLGNWSEEKFR